MINRIPDYLKLFIDEEPENVRDDFSIPQVAKFCEIFPEVTGLKLDVSEVRADGQLSFPWSSHRESSFKVAIEPTPRSKASSLADTRAFEDAFASLLNLVGETNHQLRQREAELAAAIPVVSVEADGEHLSERLQNVISGAAEIVGCTSAGLYMLDEATTSLKLRSSVGLSPQSLLKPARLLEDANADIEALAGHAVVIEDTESRLHWHAPEPCRAAMCVPISTATTILGTLWMFRNRAVDFSVNEQNIVEIAAGRIAADLERAILTEEVRALRSSATTPQVRTAVDSIDFPKTVQAPDPIVDGWELSSGFTSNSPLDFCNWYQAKSERLHVGVGTSQSSTPIHSSLEFKATHAAHTAHDPKLKHLVRLTNDSLWQSSGEGSEAMLFHAILDPTSGRIEYTGVGDLQAYILRPHCWEPLRFTNGRLGIDEVCEPEIHRQMLLPGDILFTTSLPENVGPINSVAEKLLRHMHLPIDDLKEHAIAELTKLADRKQDVAVLLAKRNDSA